MFVYPLFRPSHCPFPGYTTVTHVVCVYTIPPDGRKPYKHRREHPCCYLQGNLNKEDNFNNALTNM